MEKNGNECPSAMCEKKCKTVSHFPTFQAIRRISSGQQEEPRPATHASKELPPPTRSMKTIEIQFQADSAKLPRPVEVSQRQKVSQKKEAAEVIPVNYTSSTRLLQTERMKTASSFAPNQKNSPQVNEVASKIEPQLPPRNISAMQSNFEVECPDDKEGKKTGVEIEDKFNDYINQVRMKISRSMSNIGDER